MSLTLTDILTSFASAGLADAAAQFAFAAGDTRVMTPGSVLQAEAILRHIEEVFEDLEESRASVLPPPRPQPRHLTGLRVRRLPGGYSLPTRVPSA